jgi:hypothetical protein
VAANKVLLIALLRQQNLELLLLYGLYLLATWWLLVKAGEPAKAAQANPVLV